MLDPISLVTTGLTGYFIQSVGSGVVGNEAHRFYRHVLGRLDGEPQNVNHDIARAVRLAQIEALERVLAGYAAWAPQPAEFLAAATAFCRTQRGRIRTDPASLALPSAEPLEATIDGLLANSPAGSLAGQRDHALAAFAEDAVLAELRDGPPPIAVPDDFAAYLSKGAGPGHPRFLDEFAADIREAVKSNPRFRDIFLLSGIAELKAQGFETAEAIARIETQFGIDRREFRAALDRIEDSNRQIAKGQTAQTEMLVGIDERTKRMERIMAGWDANPAAREAEKNGLDRSTIVSLAQRLRPNEMLDFDQAMRELERAVAIACDIIARGQRGTNHDAFVNAVLARVAADTQAGDLDAGARAIDDGLAELDAAHRRSTVVLLEAAVQQHTLRRDAAVVARRIETLVAVEHEAARPAWHPAFRERYDSLYADGETKGINFPLAVAILLAQRMVTAATDASERGTAGNLLGLALWRLGERESGTARLEKAVAAYRAALEERTRERVPLNWAMTQNNLGAALQTLGARESGTARLEEAVAAYRAALEERTRERVPLDWAMTQNNLGNALATLGGREIGTARLEEAVAAYRAALEELTRERVPLDWAMTQNNLGTALQTLGARESGTARLEEAVAACRAALEEWTRERVPLDWAMTQNNLGVALRALGERESGTARLEEAVAAYRAALEEWTRERVPLDWAMTQNNLGVALRALGERESGTARLEEAVAAYRAALEERTRERVPLNWATTQNNLGNALRTLGARESGTARLEEAVAAWDQCLTVVATAWLPEWVQEVRTNREAALAEIARRATPPA